MGAFFVGKGVEAMPTKLKDLKITKVDFVDAGQINGRILRCSNAHRKEVRKWERAR